MERVKKNDTVMVVSGKDKGKIGLVLDVSPKKGKVLVKGVSVATKHLKPKKQGEVAGIKKRELYIPLSKVMPICPSTNKPCRVSSKKDEAGNKLRISSRSKEAF